MATKFLDRPFKVKSVSEAGTFTGYASVFGELDSYREIVVKGAFAKSIRDYEEGGRPVPMLWQHRSGEPIGVYTLLKEDDYGLYVEGDINLEVQRGRECLSLMKQKALSGLSIGYMLEDFTEDAKSMIRTITKVALMEISPVTFPAGPSARVIEAKNYEDLDSLQKCEEALHNMFGLSRSEATAMVSRIKSVSMKQGDPVPSAKWNEVLAELKSISKTN